jgi:hypothetical protein
MYVQQAAKVLHTATENYHLLNAKTQATDKISKFCFKLHFCSSLMEKSIYKLT